MSCVCMDRKYQYLTPLAQKVLKGHGTHNALRKLRWGFRQSVHSITAAPTSEKDEWTGEVFRAASCQRDAIMFLYRGCPLSPYIERFFGCFLVFPYG